MSEPIIQRRTVTNEDRDFLLRLYASTRENEMVLLDWDEVQKAQFLEQQFEAQDSYYRENFTECEYLVITEDDEPIGRLYLDRREDEHRIVDIALLPEHRGRGLGRALMEEILAEAGEKGLPVRIHVEQYNPALKLYERLGFRSLGEVGVYFFMEWMPPDSAR